MDHGDISPQELEMRVRARTRRGDPYALVTRRPKPVTSDSRAAHPPLSTFEFKIRKCIMTKEMTEQMRLAVMLLSLISGPFVLAMVTLII